MSQPAKGKGGVAMFGRMNDAIRPLAMLAMLAMLALLTLAGCGGGGEGGGIAGLPSPSSNDAFSLSASSVSFQDFRATIKTQRRWS